ncbi:hypothetical protein Clo1100_0601 [Clostridium sp. BNL1100]|nr:hypothetical protein Clo1100_0601 [Clostridium sp. BNL1100]
MKKSPTKSGFSYAINILINTFFIPNWLSITMLDKICPSKITIHDIYIMAHF